MDQNQPDITLEESMKQVMQALPPAIRDYLMQGKYTKVAKDLMTKHALRIDQGGVLEREVMLLLMGIENPEDFTKALAEDVKLDQQTINSIVQEVNTQIFIPLRNEMMRKPAATGTQVPVASKTEQQTQIPPRFFHLENKLPPKPTQPQPTPARPAMQPAIVATPSTLAQAIGNALSAKPKVVQPRAPFSNIAPLPPKFVSVTKPAVEPSKLLEDHEEPHIEFGKTPTQPSPAPAFVPKVQAMPAKIEPQFPPRPVASFNAPVPPNLPGAMPPFPVPDAGVQTPPVQKPVPPAPTAPTAPIKSYSADPYREPVE